MAYGRLDVFWPDGKFETFPLSETSVSVGRSSGCAIVLDTETISRYHFSITHEGSYVKIADLDSVNGTFVDGVRLPENESQILHGGEELQAGHLRMIFHNTSDHPTIPMAGISDDTQRFEQENVGFDLEVYGPEIAIPPGSHTSIEISINNNMDDDKRLIVTVSGLPQGWARINRPELVVHGGDNASVLVNIKPARQPESAPGDYPVTIKVALKEDPDKFIEATIVCTILPYGGFGMALGSKKVTGYETFKLHVHNQGSIGLPIYIMGRSLDDSLQFAVHTPQPVLAPGERQVIQGGIKPIHRRWFGQPREVSFDLLVRSRDEASFLAAIRGTYIDEALLPRWAAGGIVLALLSAIVLLLLAVIFVLTAEPAEPTIVTFSAESGVVTQGDALTVAWEVENANELKLSMGDTMVMEDGPAMTSAMNLSTEGFLGEVVLQLEAFNGSRNTSQSIVVNILPRMSVDYFEVEPTTLVRNVVEQVTVRWRVEGASVTQIEGLDSLLGAAPQEPSNGPEGTVVINAVATENFSITLTATDDTGHSIQQTMNVDLVNPECVVQSENLSVYETPDIQANVISSIEPGTILVVDRRDDTGAWIRVQLAGGVQGWGAKTNLQCAETFNPDALRIWVPPQQPENDTESSS